MSLVSASMAVRKLERAAQTATLRYSATVAGGATVALHLTFANDLLAELMIYRN